MSGQGRLTIAILGGGSLFVPGLVAAMCGKPEVFGSGEIRLHDIDPERVALVKEFCEKLVRARDVPMSLSAEPDLERSLEGADFVIATFRIGGEKSTILDEAIPPRFGYYGEETTGPGGMFMAMRTVPVIVDVAKKMERLCPDAWLVNYANPANFLADAVCRTTRINTVSLCDGYTEGRDHIAVTLGIPSDRVSTLHAGLNHFSWIYRAEDRETGRDLLKELREADPAMIESNLSGENAFNRYHIWRGYSIFKMYGVYPSITDHMDCYFYLDEARTGQLNDDEAVYESMIDEEQIRKNWADLKAVIADFSLKGAHRVAFGHETYAADLGVHSDLAVGVIDSIVTDAGALWAVNVPNVGAVPGVEADTIVELYARVDRHGCTPLVTPPLPESIVARMNHLAAHQKLVVSGILARDHNTLLEALSIHPWTTSLDRARECYEAMLEEERSLLGEYWDDVPGPAVG